MGRFSCPCGLFTNPQFLSFQHGQTSCPSYAITQPIRPFYLLQRLSMENVTYNSGKKVKKDEKAGF